MQKSHKLLNKPSPATLLNRASAKSEACLNKVSAQFPKTYRMDKFAVAATLARGKKARAPKVLGTILGERVLPIIATTNKINKQDKPGRAAATNRPAESTPIFSARFHLVDVAAVALSAQASTNVAPQLQTMACTKACNTHSRIAIAVPKRLLKSAVCRNAVKRWIRETFRQHAVRHSGADMLITLEGKLNPKQAQHRIAAQSELQRLFSEVLRRLLVAPIVTAPPTPSVPS